MLIFLFFTSIYLLTTTSEGMKRNTSLKEVQEQLEKKQSTVVCVWATLPQFVVFNYLLL